MRVFNKQRKLSLFTKKIRQYLAYALGEIVLITLGILLALQLNNWDKSIKDRAIEANLITKLLAEFTVNQSNLDSSITHVGIVATKMTDFLTLMGPTPKAVDDQVIHGYVSNYYWNPGYTPTKVVFDVSLSNGDLNLIKNTDLQEKLGTWSAMLNSNDQLEVSIGKHQGDYATAWLGLHSWKSAIAATGEMKDIGPSNFPFDQKKFLSLPALEHAVSLKLILVSMQKQLLIDISELQKEIIEMLKKEHSLS
ncbi:hypothetical protein [Thalassomonas sp. M1454]|uniref:hypothetical protein n=1 Tax=Thalassomonas sp. M1454 TaxID=2594477 RepID=UPI00117DE080|nr:hypothetical protein [Thalassomonas sp. M1454]TRX53920.1 hypothetical protein FNN08_13270 [Thalassomonas sp. M1454]